MPRASGADDRVMRSWIGPIELNTLTLFLKFDWVSGKVGYHFKALQKGRWNCSCPTAAALGGLASGAGSRSLWEAASMAKAPCWKLCRCLPVKIVVIFTSYTFYQVGVFNHVPGDGREFVVTDPTAAKVRAEDGRPVTR